MATELISFLLDFKDNASNALDSITKKVDGLGSKVSDIGAAMAPLSAISGAALGISLKMAVDFDKAVQGAARSLDLTSEEVTKFSSDVEKLQANLGFQFGTTELANLAGAAGKLGVAKEDVVDFAGTMSKLAIATEQSENLEVFSEEAAKVANVFKLGTKEVEIWGAAVNKLADTNAATVPGIVNFTKRISGLAAESGIAVGSVSAFGATMASAGLEVEQGATFFKSFLRVMGSTESLANPAKEALREMGIEASDLQKAFSENSEGAMLDFLDKLNKLDDISKRNIIAKIFGAEHMGSATLLAGQVESLRKNIAAASDESGNLQKLNNEFDALAKHSIEGQMRAFQNQLAEIGKQIGMVLLPGLLSILQALTPIVANIASMAQANPIISKIVAGVLLLGTAIAPVLFLVGNAITAITAISGLLSGGLVAGLSAAVAAAFPFIAAATAIAGAAYLIYKNWGGISSFFREVFRQISETFGNLGVIIGTSFNNMIVSARGHMRYFTSMLTSAGSYAGQMLIWAFTEGMKKLFSPAWGTLSDFVARLRAYLPSSPAKIGALSDLDKSGEKFVSTFMSGINSADLGAKINSALQSGMSTPMATANAGSGNSNNSGITVNYSPTINGSKLDGNAILAMLKKEDKNLIKLIEESVKKINRNYY